MNLNNKFTDEELALKKAEERVLLQKRCQRFLPVCDSLESLLEDINDIYKFYFIKVEEIKSVCEDEFTRFHEDPMVLIYEKE